MNQINVIAPYRHLGGWVFDDDAVGLSREPFVAGADVAIDKIIDQLGIKGDKIKMTFSAGQFPGYDLKLEYLKMDVLKDGDFYGIDSTDQFTKEEDRLEHWDNDTFVLWLCPALLKYFDDAPEEIYVKVEELA
jgi:hypothetical protein